MRMMIFNSGYTRDMLDCRVAIWPAILIRLSTYMITLVPPLLNPVIYMYSRPALYRACCKMVGKKVNNVDDIALQ